MPDVDSRARFRSERGGHLHNVCVCGDYYYIIMFVCLSVYYSGTASSVPYHRVE